MKRQIQRVFLIGVVSIGVLFSATIVRASPQSDAPVDDPTRAYWLEAHRLTQAQVSLLNRVEQSAEQPESTRFRILSGQVLLYTSAVDRFLKSNYPESDLLCSPPAGLGEFVGTDSASLEQVQVYCSLHRSTRELALIRTRLTHQASLLNRESPTAISRDVLVLVEASRQRLAQMQPAFPQDLRISITQPTAPAESATVRELGGSR